MNNKEKFLNSTPTERLLWFLEWLQTKPKDKIYSYIIPSNCPMAQFASQMLEKPVLCAYNCIQFLDNNEYSEHIPMFDKEPNRELYNGILDVLGNNYRFGTLYIELDELLSKHHLI